MNKTASFFLAPITSIFSRDVYQDAAKASGGKGVLYILYWSFLIALIVTIMVVSQLMPMSDKFVAWAQKEMPVVIWTPDGISLADGQEKAILNHPTYGPIAIFDMKKTSVTKEDMREVYVFVTSTKVFVKNGSGSIEERNITKTGLKAQRELPPKVRITGEWIGKFYQTAKRAFMLLFPFLVLAGSFFAFLIGNLLYSIAGLLLNLMRKSKLRYGAIFNLTCFATGVSLTLMLIKTLTPLRMMPWPISISIIISLLYMFFAFRITDSDNAKA